jgi:hypothetical protein
MAEPNDTTDRNERESRSEYLFKVGVRWMVFFGASAFGAVFLFGAVSTIYYEQWVIQLAREHFAATVGLPFAALAALCLVILLEITAGSVEIKGFGFEFKGAGGPIVMWIFSFLAIAAAIKMLW